MSDARRKEAFQKFPGNLSSARAEYLRFCKLIRDYDDPTPPSADLEWKRLLARANKAKDLYNAARLRCGLSRIRP